MSPDPENMIDGEIVIEPAQMIDRAALYLLAPESRHLIETGWALVALHGQGEERAVVGAVILTTRYVTNDEATLGIRLNMLPKLFETELPHRLLQPALDAAREWGAQGVRVLTHIPTEGIRATTFKQLGFVEADTFDCFELDLKETIDDWNYAENLIKRTFKDIPEYEIVPLHDGLTRPVARAWSNWIGGQMEDQVDLITRSIAGLPSSIETNYSRVALLDNEVIGLALGRVHNDAWHVDALAVRPDSRLTGVQNGMLAQAGTNAVNAGATKMIFEAGRLQPNTQRVASRKKAKLLTSKVAFVRDLAPLI